MALPIVADRVKETTATTGTGTVTFDGAVAGYRTFSEVFYNGAQVYYCIDGGAEWEVGLGTLTSGSPWTLARTTVKSSSNAGALVNFSAGTKSVFCTVPAAGAALLSGCVFTGPPTYRGPSNVSTNSVFGDSALLANTTGSFCTAMGNGALQTHTGDRNTCFGAQSLYYGSGNYNVAVGMSAMYGQSGQSSGEYNTSVGCYAMYSYTNGAYNTAVGYQSILSNNSGSNNTAIGAAAGYGSGTNANTSGGNNTFIGAGAVGASGTASNVITLGNSAIATLRCQVTSITALSDARDKTDVEPLPFGLDFINQLSPVSFTWAMRDGAKVGVKDCGFLAQDLQAAQESVGGAETLALVYDENPEKLEATYGRLIPVLVKAIQEQSALIAALRDRLDRAGV